ncbi:hypothetical protein D9V87_09355 [Bacteroidetes/Chlorobi group bacterium MS-B_bin-24]|nr:MAG: hypothetical protein D9V87_09355 [Bacteroidetes/Chlorobi group bacterium MS-B_bin-24]
MSFLTKKQHFANCLFVALILCFGRSQTFPEERVSSFLNNFLKLSLIFIKNSGDYGSNFIGFYKLE